jgi:hypothetical protein
MSEFPLQIRDGDLNAAKAALEGAGIETHEAGASYVSEEMQLHALYAVLDADTVEDAMARVRENLPDGDGLSSRFPISSHIVCVRATGLSEGRIGRGLSPRDRRGRNGSASSGPPSRNPKG